MKKIILFILLSLSIFSEPYEIKNIKVCEENCNIFSIGFNQLKLGYNVLDDKVYYVPIQNLYEVRLIESEGKDFEILNEYYGKNKDYVYYEEKKMEGVDIQTFKVIKGRRYDSEDKNFYYYKGKVLDTKENDLK